MRKRIRHRREREFVENYFDHDDWQYEPRFFRLENGTKYTPDFYDGKRDVWIEVAGTSQAYSRNKEKYKMFAEQYPELKFEIMHPSGELWRSRKKYSKTAVIHPGFDRPFGNWLVYVDDELEKKIEIASKLLGFENEDDFVIHAIFCLADKVIRRYS